MDRLDHQVRLGIIACIVLLIGLTGCSDKKAPDSSATISQPLADIAGIAAVPATATAVIGVDVDSLVQSAIVSRAVQRMFAQDSTLELDLTKVFTACEFDIRRDLQTAMIALIPSQDQKLDSLLIAEGTFEETKLVDCVGQLLSKSGETLQTATLAGRTAYHQVVAGAPQLGLWFAFGSRKTLLVASARDALRAALSTDPKLLDEQVTVNAGLPALLRRTNTTASLWAVGRVTESIGAGLVAATAQNVAAPLAVTVQMDLQNGLSVAIHMQMQTADDAKTLVKLAKSQLAAAALVLQSKGIGPLISAISFSQKRQWAQLDWHLSESELLNLLEKISGPPTPPKSDSKDTPNSTIEEDEQESVDNVQGNDENPAPKSKRKLGQENGYSKPNSKKTL